MDTQPHPPLVTVSGKHLEITPAIRQHASEKVSRLQKHYDRIRQIDVLADKTHHNGSLAVEVIVHVERADPFIVNLEGPDLYACIDEAVHKLERMLTDHKERHRNRKHPGH